MPQREGVRLIIRNIGFAATYAGLVKAIGEYPRILDLHLAMQAEGKQNKGWAICRVSAADAEKLLKANLVLDGRIQHAR